MRIWWALEVAKAWHILGWEESAKQLHVTNSNHPSLILLVAIRQSPTISYEKANQKVFFSSFELFTTKKEVCQSGRRPHPCVLVCIEALNEHTKGGGPSKKQNTPSIKCPKKFQGCPFPIQVA